MAVRHSMSRGELDTNLTIKGAWTFDADIIFNSSVGIGTSSPQKNLHIESTVPTIRLSDSNAATDQAVATLIELYRGNLTNRVGFWGMASSSNDVMQLATDYAAGEIVFSTGSNSEAVRIDSAGNVGIGIAIPTSKLDVAGTLTLSSTQPVLDFNETDGPADEKFWRWTASIGDLYLQTKTDVLGAGANVLRVTRTGTTVDLIRAVATSVDVVGALTATSYGGIPEANLLDKAATETVSGGWTFSADLTIPVDIDISLGGGATFRGEQQTLADDATGTFACDTYAMIFVVATFDDECYAIYAKDSANAPIVIHEGTRIVSGTANPDTDAKVNFWTSAGGEVSIKNRLGSTRTFDVFFLGN